MAHHATIWYEAADYMIRSANMYREKNAAEAKNIEEMCSKLFERALADESPVRASVLLYFKYAEFEEQRRNFAKVHTIYQTMYQKTIGGGPVISEQDQKVLDIESDGIIRVDDPLAMLPPITVKDPTLVYIQHMRFARRAEGIKSARAVFKKARADERISYHVYVFAALMEYNCTKDTAVSQKIFELGLKRFKNDVEFLQQYTKFMQTLNESNNTRVLYERVLADTYNSQQQAASSAAATKQPNINDLSNSTTQTKFLWSDYLKFESMIGDLASIESVEQRKILNTIAQDSVSITNTFALTDAVKQTQNSSAGIAMRDLQRERENIDNIRTDTSFLRSDLIQRNKTHVFIDRYKFLDLSAISDPEMRSQGIDKKSLLEINQELLAGDEKMPAKGHHGGAVGPDVDGKGKKKKKGNDEKASHWRLGRRPMADQVSMESRNKYTENESFVRPSFKQMTPFKPEHHPWPSRIGTKGGNFPPPPAAAALMLMMPPPWCFLGPFVIIDQLLDKMRTTKLPEKKEYVSAVKSGDIEKTMLVKKEESGLEESEQNGSVGKKRTNENGDEKKMDGESDIFKIRAMKRSKQTVANGV